ncbi:MAG: hypothetical protein E7673_01775 [Ruminococcaceae bacterium]|nr:hypothetical protein [Oscillospiraceae bacterium]
MEEKICSFFGHSEIEPTEELRSSLEAEILKVIDLGCRTFYFGGYGEFDELAYKTVTRIKAEHTELELKRIYCVSQERYLRKRVRYFDPANYDEVIYLEPDFDGWKTSIYFRNCAMVDKSSFVIFYVEERENSGSYKAYKYAMRKKKANVVNLFK